MIDPPPPLRTNVTLGRSSRTNVTLAQSAAVRRLRESGVDSPEYDARALLAHVLGVAPSRLVLAEPTPAQWQRFDRLVGERADRVPLQHLTGVAGFRRLELAVGPGVFVPRPETESLVQWGLDQLGTAQRPVVVDLCAGSGAIALSIATEHPAATVVALEREVEAFAWLQRNAGATGAAVRLVRADVADVSTVLPELAGAVDLVLANPPYIPDGAGVQREVAEHDPPAALWGGPDGLATVRLVGAAAHWLLRPGGAVGIEHADRQGESVPALLRSMGGWQQVADHRDLAGRPRFATATTVVPPSGEKGSGR